MVNLNQSDFFHRIKEFTKNKNKQIIALIQIYNEIKKTMLVELVDTIDLGSIALRINVQVVYIVFFR